MKKILFLLCLALLALSACQKITVDLAETEEPRNAPKYNEKPNLNK